MARLLVLDDQESVAYSTGVLLRREGYQVDTCSEADKAVQLALRNSYDVVISDLRLEATSGIEVLTQLRKQKSCAEVIIMTAFASIETAVEAMRQGAFDYICKPFQADELLVKIGKAIEKRRLSVLHEGQPSCIELHPLVGSAPSLLNALNRARTIAQSDCTVLLTGETGTGKSLLARAIHAWSARASRTLISVNCANLSDQLLESELFGSIKGAFTGADISRGGLCEAAELGTLFLDEIGAASLTVQSKLLTLLEEKVVRRLGDTRTLRVDIRLIAATNADLRDRIVRQEFREDLFYRLNVATIHLLPLRERPEDIPLLAQYFVESLAKKYGKPVNRLDESALRAIEIHRFPGNVRELENILEQAVLTASSETIGLDDLELFDSQDSSVNRPETDSLDEQEFILRTIAANKYNLRKTALILGISRATLYRRLRRYGLNPR